MNKVRMLNSEFNNVIPVWQEKAVENLYLDNYTVKSIFL